MKSGHKLAAAVVTISTFWVCIHWLTFQNQHSRVVILENDKKIQETLPLGQHQRGRTASHVCENLLTNLTNGRWVVTSPAQNQHYDNLLSSFWQKRGILRMLWREDGKCGYQKYVESKLVTLPLIGLSSTFDVKSLRNFSSTMALHITLLLTKHLNICVQ